MTSIVWGWSDFWNWYNNVEDERIKQETLEQIDIHKLFKSINKKEKIEFMQYAPVSVRNTVLSQPTNYIVGKVVLT